jgi:hypothetical protein
MRIHILGQNGKWHKVMPLSVSFESGKKIFKSKFLENGIAKNPISLYSPFQTIFLACDVWNEKYIF